MPIITKPGWRVVGHRGYPACYPENTLAGFKAALALGVDAIELDIQLTQDGVPIVLHDTLLERTTNACGLVTEKNFADLQEVSCHYPERFGQVFKPQPLLSLKELSEELHSLIEHPQVVFLEIKKEPIGVWPRNEYLASVLEASEALGKKRVLISFDREIINLACRESSLKTAWCLDSFDDAVFKTAREQNIKMLVSSSALAGGLRDSESLPDGPWEWFIYGVETFEQASAWCERGAVWIEADDPSLVMPQ